MDFNNNMKTNYAKGDKFSNLKNNNSSFRFPLIEDEIPALRRNSLFSSPGVAKQRLQRSSNGRGQSNLQTKKTNSPTVFSPTHPTVKMGQRKDITIQRTSSEAQRRFQPLEIPPPMHLINNRSSSEIIVLNLKPNLQLNNYNSLQKIYLNTSEGTIEDNSQSYLSRDRDEQLDVATELLVDADASTTLEHTEENKIIEDPNLNGDNLHEQEIYPQPGSFLSEEMHGFTTSPSKLNKNIMEETIASDVTTTDYNGETETCINSTLENKLVIDVNVNINDNSLTALSTEKKLSISGLPKKNNEEKKTCSCSTCRPTNKTFDDIPPVHELNTTQNAQLRTSNELAPSLITEPESMPTILEETGSIAPKPNGDLSNFRSNEVKQVDPEKEQPISQTTHTLSDSVYKLPTIDLLNDPQPVTTNDDNWLEHKSITLNNTLRQFGVKAKVTSFTYGPSITRYEIQPEPGVKVSKITNLADDLKLSLAAREIRIEAPIPGRQLIGIEIPNPTKRPVVLKEIIDSHEFNNDSSSLGIPVGLGISGKSVVTDLTKMPHGLVAGATGSGKSVFINTLLIGLLYKNSPANLRLLLIDPKMVELNSYNDLPHLISPVINDPIVASASLKWAVEEMERRYALFVQSGARNITSYNENNKKDIIPLPYIVIIIDELADLMMSSPGDVEESICRLAQKARAAGIHLIVATQRPSVDVITGLIKANIPTRIAFSVSSQTDSRTILDQGGADKLLGQGDLLFLENGTSKPVRIQGSYVSDQEIENVIQFIKQQNYGQNFLFTPKDLESKVQNDNLPDIDPLLNSATIFAVETGSLSASSLQRKFRIGYNRAARLIDLMEDYGIVSAQNGSKPRTVLISEQNLHEIDNVFN